MTRKLIAFDLHCRRGGYELAPATPMRSWMGETDGRHAYRCLPLLIANQAGWLVLNRPRVRVRWNGGPHMGAITVESEEYPAEPISHFGSGIITWTIPYLFRTEPGYNLLVRGPANNPKDGIAALEGIVETDWTVATFTMNWQVTRRDTWITFERGEPIAMIVPQRRTELEEFMPEIRSIDTEPELREAHERWQAGRKVFNNNLKVPGSPAGVKGWEKDYFRGQSPGDGPSAPEHQTRLRLRPFSNDTRV